MANKIRITTTSKRHIRENFSRIKKADLTKEQLRYYNAVKGGKNRAKEGVKVKGKYVGGDVKEMIIKLAEKRKTTPKKYAQEHEESLYDLITKGFTHVNKRTETAIGILDASPKKKIEVRDGKGGIQKVSKIEAIAMIAKFQNYVKSNSSAVMISIKIITYPDGRIAIVLPKQYRGKKNDDLIEYLEDNEGIELIVSENEDE